MMQRNAAESPKDHRRRRTQEYFHDTEMIFVLPSLEMCLRSIHTQGEHEPASDGKYNTCTLILLELEKHINTQGEHEPASDGKYNTCTLILLELEKHINTQGEHEPASDGKINATRVRNTYPYTV